MLTITLVIVIKRVSMHVTINILFNSLQKNKEERTKRWWLLRYPCFQVLHEVITNTLKLTKPIQNTFY